MTVDLTPLNFKFCDLWKILAMHIDNARSSASRAAGLVGRSQPRSPVPRRPNAWFLANVNSCSCSLYVVVRPSVCLSVCRLSVVCLSSVTFVHPTQAIEIFGNVSMPFGTLAICNLSIKILRRSSQGNPSGEGLNQRGAAKYSDFRTFQGYISETVQDRS